MPITFPEHVQKLDLGAIVELFEVDLTLYGLGVLYYFKGDEGADPIEWDGQEYVSHPVQASGYESSTDGAQGRPKFGLSNISGIFTALITANNNWLGATVRRIVTYENFLDGGADADPTQHQPIDQYIINRKLGDEGDWVAFELASPMDVEGFELPARIANRDYCDMSYRYVVGGVFVYTNVTCLWGRQSGTGEDADGWFNAQDEPVLTKAEDDCGRRVGSCKLRFGEFNPLPWGGFAGLSRSRAGT